MRQNAVSASDAGGTMTHPLKGANRLKLGVFSANADGGLAITDVPERWKAGWDDNLTAAQIADRAGLEFFLPIARWAGFGGKNHVREWSFETFTWAAALAASTRQIGLFMTVHVPLVHPLYAAKALATVDHVSGGRAGLNIVCGWNPKEFAMFGTPLVEKGYDQAAEWIEVIEKAYASDDPFDFEGSYYKLKGVVSRPASLQAPRPVTMNAAFGGPGRDFAAAHCDYLFTTFTEIDAAGSHVEDIRARAEKAGRDVGVYTVCHVVCRETQAEADDYYERYAVELADHAAVDIHMAGKKEFSQSHDATAYERYRKRFAGGAGSYPLVGTPEKIVEDMAAISAKGYAGIALSFVNYTQELPFFCDRVLPLLRKAGLRQ
jgi:FMNH2-dependent dimethyl sulfone monooxygenase